ncbi:hypothetical protein COCMIDRAFT_25843 [Bipolaris oryzae ATCC 44560]|uniref:Uncharacterized protein n=1 Tax=Bipolaris oryzae ATCC 44560 TaxID=930090 RepID=W6Z2T2_COCMI|nr:uncharacterized protein COCMIDRAFT_25843 [Bipolaris oryzae ATCC 44560]EUC46062.1 hypothetical protein COCMIDRAFT_25843 [Bipolaris oryzae ATCC 44560]
MDSPPQQFTPDAFSRTEIQDMLDDAQIDAEYLYTNIPCLRDQLQQLLWEAIEECNSRDVDPMVVLHRTLFNERTILDAYNKHRLGNAVTPFNAQVVDPENAVEYIPEENIPEVLGWFPLRAAVAKHDIDIQAEPIYQVVQTTEAKESHTTEGSSSETLSLPNHTPQKPSTSESATTWTPSTSSAALNYNKLRDAPSPWLPFPTGNLTMAEVTAFLPQSIKSFDIITRFISNGALAMTLASMINHYRAMPTGPIENNTIYRMMKGQMNLRAKSDPVYKDWTVTKHADIKKPASFNPYSVSVTGFHTPENAMASPQSPQTILFRDLAKGVKIMPSGPDALDLTRCVQYCLEHENEDWHYPTDFAALVQNLGGPAAVCYEHCDAEAIDRHSVGLKLTKVRRAPVGRGRGQERGRGRGGRARKVKSRKAAVVEESEDEEEELESTSTSASSSPSLSSEDGDGDVDAEGETDEDADIIAANTPTKRKNAPLSSSSLPSPKRSRKIATRKAARKAVESESEDGGDDDAYVGPKTKTKRKTAVATRSSGRTKRFEGSYRVE